MTDREEIYRLARAAWLMGKHDCSDDWFVRADIDEENVVEFAALVAAAAADELEELRSAVKYLRERYLQFHEGGLSKKEFLAECQGVLVGDAITDLLGKG